MFSLFLVVQTHTQRIRCPLSISLLYVNFNLFFGAHKMKIKHRQIIRDSIAIQLYFMIHPLFKLEYIGKYSFITCLELEVSSFKMAKLANYRQILDKFQPF